MATTIQAVMTVIFVVLLLSPLVLGLGAGVWLLRRSGRLNPARRQGGKTWSG